MAPSNRPLFQSYPTAQPDGANPYPSVRAGMDAILQRMGGAAPRARWQITPEPQSAIRAVTEQVPPGRNPPPTPVGVSIAANIAEAQKHRDDPWPAKLKWFYDQVHNGGPWDYKQRPANTIEERENLQDFGNYHYGLVGDAAGIPKWLLDRAAGGAQDAAHTSTPAWGSPLGGPPYGDDPRDQWFIDMAIGDRRKTCFR